MSTRVKKTNANYIQHDGWSTSKSDPGNICPKCGGYLIFDPDDDGVIYCENDSDVKPCDFQYTFTEKEREANDKAFWDDMDARARKHAQELIAKEGRPVFGVTRPESFALPSAYKGDDGSGW